MFFIPYGTYENEPRQRFPYITALLVLANIAVFVIQVSILAEFGVAGLSAFFDQYAAIPADITADSPFQIGLVSSMFMHGDLLHIASNMVFLMAFGDNVEDRLGHARFLAFYLLSGLLATIIYVLFNMDSTVPLVGASGAIAGILAGYLMLHPKGQVKGLFVFIIIPFRLMLPAVFFIGYWFIVQLISGAASFDDVSDASGVAYLAHVGGFLAGLVLAPLFSLRERRTRRS